MGTATKRSLEPIGEFHVTNEDGYTRTVTIRREDLTTTNDAYRCVRDLIAEALSATLGENRGER